MPSFNLLREIEIHNTFRNRSVIDKFDLNIDHVKETFTGSLDIENKEWSVGVIHGASGTGKSTIVKELFPKNYIKEFNWSKQSVIENMPKEQLEDIYKTFNSVGFSSPPSWLKPYQVLSNGEKMRVNLARAILEEKDLIVFDEFTSVVDRNVAQIGSAAVQKAIRRAGKRFIAVTCHNDVLKWLKPDWVFNTDDMTFKFGRYLRRPKIEITLKRCAVSEWRYFRKYHYLNYNLNKSAVCFVAYWKDQRVGFTSSLHFPHNTLKNFKIEHRTVVLPDFQGVGIGGKISDWIAEYWTKKGFKFLSITSNPAFIAYRKKSPLWTCKRFGRVLTKNTKVVGLNKTQSSKRITTTWEFKNERS